MTGTQNPFIWYDVMTTDTKAGTAFYTDVLGWSAKDSEMPGQKYTLFSVGSEMAAGLMELPKEASDNGTLPTWMGYIYVDNVDAYSDKIKAAGGHIFRAAADIPEIGRFAVAGDPTGAAFIIFQPQGIRPERESGHASPDPVGRHELRSIDPDKALAFYMSLFGWTKDAGMEWDEGMGIYQMFAIDGRQAGAVITSGGADKPSRWHYYLNVPTLDIAVAKVASNGGQVCMGPIEVLGSQWIANCTDAQGVSFGLLAPKR